MPGMTLIVSRREWGYQIWPKSWENLLNNVLSEVPVLENRTSLASVSIPKPDLLDKETSCRYYPYKLKRKTSTKGVKLYVMIV